jgi:hypothetical protein
MGKMHLAWLAVLLIGAAASQAARAVVVAPGQTQALSGTTSAANPDLAGFVQSDPLIPFTIVDAVGTVLIQGNVQDRIVRSNNLGTLIFGPRVRDLVAPSGDAWIVGLRVEGYAGVSTDIDFRTDTSPNIGPDEVSRSAPSGSLLFFSYDPNIIVPPDEALPLSILTNATESVGAGRITIFAQNDFGAQVYETTLEGTNIPAVDRDGDGRLDPFDNCPVVSNPGQEDDDENDIGDACECGDQNGDGTVDVSDLLAINAAIFDPGLVTPLCDTNDDGFCNVDDILGANAKIFGAPAYCEAFPPPDAFVF